MSLNYKKYRVELEIKSRVIFFVVLAELSSRRSSTNGAAQGYGRVGCCQASFFTVVKKSVSDWVLQLAHFVNSLCKI
jgi:hypothetical protein